MKPRLLNSLSAACLLGGCVTINQTHHHFPEVSSTTAVSNAEPVVLPPVESVPDNQDIPIVPKSPIIPKPPVEILPSFLTPATFQLITQTLDNLATHIDSFNVGSDEKCAYKAEIKRVKNVEDEPEINLEFLCDKPPTLTEAETTEIFSYRSKILGLLSYNHCFIASVSGPEGATNQYKQVDCGDVTLTIKGPIHVAEAQIY